MADTITLQIEGMTCDSCAMYARQALEAALADVELAIVPVGCQRVRTAGRAAIRRAGATGP